MKITLKVICRELLNDLPSGEYEIPGLAQGDSRSDDASPCVYSAAEAVALCALAAGKGTLTEDQLARPMYILNGKNVSRTVPVADGDTLMAVRPVIGG